MAKAELLEAVEENQPEHFLSYLSKYNKKRRLTELEEALCELNRGQVAQIWARLHSWFDYQLNQLVAEDESHTKEQNLTGPEIPFSDKDEVFTIKTAAEKPARHGKEGDAPVIYQKQGEEEQQIIEMQENRHLQNENSQNLNMRGYDEKLLVGIVDFACIYLNSFKEEDIYIPNMLLEMAEVLHGMVNAVEGVVQSSVVQLCEKWWTRQLDQHEHLISNVLPILLQATLRTNAQKKDVVRLWSVFEAVKLMPLSSPECEAFTGQLVLCAGATVFLSCDEGIKWLAGLLLQPSLFCRIHKLVKAVLPTCTKLQSAKYAEVYFRAWKISQGEMRKNIEENCIQDLMYAGIHVDPLAGRLSMNLHHFLHQIHRQKRHHAVSSMIYTLYQPILWRSLKVANGLVRMNAAGLLCDAFPLLDATLTQEERGDLMERQYQAITVLLTDPCHLVRITAIKGVFSILSSYWLIVPSHIIKTIFQKLLSELVYDASSSEVRTQVVKGLTLLLDSRDAVPFLTDVLPRVGEVFDDPSVNVRVAFVRMLLKVKASKATRYWDIVRIEHLLHRLEEDKPVVCKLLTQLLLSSFHPSGTEDQELVQRCLALLEENRAASRRFYQYASRCLDLPSTVHFMLLLWRCLTNHVKMHHDINSPNQDGENSSGNRDDAKDPETTGRRSYGSAPTLPHDKENLGTDTEGSDERSQRESERNDSNDDDDIINEDEDGTPLDNPDVIGGLFDTVVILWTTNAHRLALPQNLKFLHALRTKVAKNMPLFFKFFKDDDEVYQTLLYLSSFLPCRLVPTLVGHCLSRLRTSQAEQGTENYATYINALCNWNRADDVLELASDWLDEGFKQGTSTAAKERRKTLRGVRFHEVSTPQPLLAVRMVQHILQHPLNKLSAFEKYRHLLIDTTRNMARVKDIIAERLSHSEELSTTCSDIFLCECWGQYLSLVAVLHNPTAKQHSSSQESEKDDKEEGEESDGEQPDDLLFDSSACICECWDWATSTLVPKLDDDVGGKRKDRASDEGKAVTSDVLGRLITASTHIIMAGVATTQAVHSMCSEVDMLIKTDVSGSFWQKSLDFAVEAHKFLEVYKSNSELQGTDQHISPKDVVNSVVSSISEYAKHHSALPQDNEIVNNSLMLALGVLGQDSKHSQDQMMKHTASTVISHLCWIIDKNRGVDLGVKKVCGLGECVGLLVGVCQGRAKLSAVFMEALTDLISTAIFESTSLLAGSYLIKVLALDSGKISRYSLKQAVLAIDNIISRVILYNSTDDISNPASVGIYEQYAMSAKKILQDLKSSLGVV